MIVKARESAVPGSEAQCPAILGNRVELQLLTTLRCNLKCTYCSLGVGEVLGSQREITYTLDQLDAFIEAQLAGKEIYITFYGGEPTLNLDLMIAVMRRYPEYRFQLQTNGTLTARVTWSSADTSFEELDQLTQYFDYIYFQFVAQEGAYAEEALVKKREVIAKLVERFFAGDTLYPFIPIMGTVRNKVLPSRAEELCAGMTQCRTSTHILNVMPDGKIYPCPDLLYLPEMLQGDVVANWLRRSPLQPHPDMPCERCGAFKFCRRNCMKNLYLAYVKGEQTYRESVVEPICDLVRFLGEEVDRHDPHAWYARMPLAVRDVVAGCPVYEYVEVMP